MMSVEVKRIFALLNDPRDRERILQAMNRENMYDVDPVGGYTGDKLLKELNEMTDLESDAGQKESPDR
jgi:hypothetical protein